MSDFTHGVRTHLWVCQPPGRAGGKIWGSGFRHIWVHIQAGPLNSFMPVGKPQCPHL